MIDPGLDNEITGYIGCLLDLDFVNGGRHHAGFGIELAHVFERRFFSDFIEDLQQASEPEVSEQWFIHDHEAAAQGKITAQREGPVKRGVIGPGHISVSIVLGRSMQKE